MPTVKRAFLLAPTVALLLAGCDGGDVHLPPIPTVAPGTAPATAITVSGAVAGMLTAPGVSCVSGGSAGVVVTIQGTIGGNGYLLTFDAAEGTTDLAAAASSHAVVEFAPLQGSGNWGANPSRHLGSGTLVVTASGGRLGLHLVAGPGSPPGATVDISGTYGCSTPV